MRRSRFRKTLVMTLSAWSLAVACDPALAPACATRRNIERPVGTIAPQQPPTPLPAPWPPPSTPQSRLALREVRTADTRADFAPDFGMNTKARSKEQETREPAEGESSTSKVAGASRLAVETLDRLAQSAPILEDARGKFVRLSSDELFEPGKSELSPLANFALENIAQSSEGSGPQPHHRTGVYRFARLGRRSHRALSATCEGSPSVSRSVRYPRCPLESGRARTGEPARG